MDSWIVNDCDNHQNIVSYNPGINESSYQYILILFDSYSSFKKMLFKAH